MHQAKSGEKDVRRYEKFVTEIREEGYMAKAGAMQDEGYVAEAKTETMQQEREEVDAALLYAAIFHCLVEQWRDCEELRPKPNDKSVFVEKKSDNMKHRTEWCGSK